MRNSELELWNKIAAFQFDKPGVKLTFAKRLAKENALSEPFAHEIVDEYRRFIFLCCASKEQVSPSHFVDLAWHLHLTYTRSYWDDLCRDTIGRELHHNPTEGGRAEDEKFKNLYSRTLELYAQYFPSRPPETVWPKENVSESNESRFWMIPKPAFSLRRQNLLPILAIVLSTLLVGCTAYSGTLTIVIFVIVLIGIIFLVARNNRRRGEGGSGCGSSGCGSIFGGDDSGGSGGDSGCSSGGCGGGCGGGD
jgi:hypothetical protein